MKKLGLIVNPIAGMGGKVGLKGTDGPEILATVRDLGVESVAPDRAIRALRILKQEKCNFSLITYPGEMGADEAKKSRLEAKIIGHIKLGKTNSEDTKRAGIEMLSEGVDLIIFAGGDGTASDLLDSVGTMAPILGIPTGVKMYSAIFANTPEAAGSIAARFLCENLPLHEAEVMDIDEDAYRRGQLVANLKGYAIVPYEPVMLQTTKEGSTGYDLGDQKSLAHWVFELMEKGRIYILGPGTTNRAVAEELGIYDSTLLGIDLVKDFKLLAKDVNEEQILEAIERNAATIIVSPIGKQGFILGRGNLQLSSEVLRRGGKENVWIIATPEKLAHTPTLKVDTGDDELDDNYRGYWRVITNYRESIMVKVI